MAKTTAAVKKDTAVYKFATSSNAWAFMRACDDARISAGFPGLKVHTVEVGIATWIDREAADKLAKAAGGEIVSYEFAKKAVH